MDVRMVKGWAFFFVVIGMNSITIFCLKEFVSFSQIASFFLKGVLEQAGSAQPLISALGVVAAEWLLLGFLYRHKIFLRL